MRIKDPFSLVRRGLWSKVIWKHDILRPVPWACAGQRRRNTNRAFPRRAGRGDETKRGACDKKSTRVGGYFRSAPQIRLGSKSSSRTPARGSRTYAHCRHGEKYLYVV